MQAKRSPLKARISLYIIGGHGKFEEEFKSLGKYKTGKPCVYINKLEDIDVEALKKMIKVSYDYIGNIFQPLREEFESSVKLRSKSEILDELDKIYRMNWACVDARIKGQQVSGNINPSVVHERHYSINWLTSYQNQDWDDVQTNT